MPASCARPLIGLLLAAILLSLPCMAQTIIQFDAAVYEPFKHNPDAERELTKLADAVREFEARHPGVRVQYVTKPAIDPETWLHAHLKSGHAPDVVMLQADFCNSRVQHGWFVPLDPYLEQPNPYAPEFPRWIDQFYQQATNARRAPDSRLYVIPFDQVGTAIFYNKDLFARAGIGEDELPATWAEFMEIHRRLDAAGIIPFCMTSGFNMRLGWAWRIMMDQLYDELIDQLDVRAETQGGFPGVDDQEFVRAYKKGLVRVEDPRFLEFFRILKDWEPYWQRGHLATGDDKLFRLGKAAMFWDGSWAIGQLDRDKLRNFEYGVFAVPPLTKETTPFATGRPPRSVGGATAIQWAVTDAARKRGHVDLVIDLLRTITAPHHAGAIISEAELFLPNLRGVEMSAKMAAFEQDLAAGHVLFGDHPNISEGGLLGDRWFRLIQSWVGGRYTLDDVTARLRFMFDDEVERLLRVNAHAWRFSDDWEIIPVESPPAPQPLPESSMLPGYFAFLGAVLAIAVILLLLNGRPGRTLRRAWSKRAAYAMLAPCFILLFSFSYYPIVAALGYSFADWSGAGQARWIGLGNFIELVHDPVIRESLANMAIMTLCGILIGVTAPLFAAELIFHLRSPRWQYWYRVLFVVPMVVPGVVTLLVWGLLYDYNLGLFNRALTALGLPAVAWLSDPHLALYSLIFIGFPFVGGLGLLIYYAGLQNIPPSVLESAAIDGATGWTRFWHFDLPLVTGQIKLMVVLSVIGSIQGFQTQLILSGGGPGYSTMVPGLHMYQNAMQFDRMGYACAIGTALFALILALTYLNMKYLRSSTEYEAA